MPKTTQKALAASLVAGLLAVSAGTVAHAQATDTLTAAAPCFTAHRSSVPSGA